MKKTIAGTILCIATLIPNCYQHACLAQQATSQKRTTQVSQILGGKKESAKATKGTSGSQIRLVGAQFPARISPTTQQKTGLGPLVPLQTSSSGQTIGGSPLKPLITKKNSSLQNPFRPLVQPKKKTVQGTPDFVPTPIIRPISTVTSPAPKKSVSSKTTAPVIAAPIVSRSEANMPGTKTPATRSPIARSLPSPISKGQSGHNQLSTPIKVTKDPSAKLALSKKEQPIPIAKTVAPKTSTPKAAGIKQLDSSQWKEIETKKSVASSPAKTAGKKTVIKKTSLVSSPKSKVTSPAKKTSLTSAAQPKRQDVATDALKRKIANQTEDQIKVEEFSNDQLIDMILNERERGSAPNIPSVVNSSIVPRPTKTESKTFQVSNAKQVLHGDQEHFGDIHPEPMAANRQGLNFSYSRPACVDHLKYDGCGSVSGATRYVIAEALYYDRSDGNFSASALPAGDGYSYNWGGRITIGRRFDSIEGWEMSFTGIDAWNRQTVNNSPGGGLFARLAPVGGFTPITLAGFTNGLQHVQTQKGHYTSFEFNRMGWNWDVLSTFIGFRYNGVDDQYALTGISAIASNSYRIRARNNMAGIQAGGEFFYDIGRRLSFSGKGKIAGYLNIVQTDTELFFNNNQLVDNQDEETNLAWGIDLGFYTRYNLSPRAKLKFGYEFSYLGELAIVRNQFNGFISPFSGLDLQDDEDVFLHGAVFGLEWYR